ncbi:hypothetical protein B0H34DRAFT_658955 [Crassisporium funariophilum]|nr:hypothetical protein B0H34DRAFT_658955 [Crassisporium funariophilum]
MPALDVARATNATYAPSYIPTIVVTGATSGIGQGITEAFARCVQGRAHIILVGRNRAAAESIIASLPQGAEGSTYEFLQCDVTLMKNVHALAKDIASRVSKINFLVHVAGVLGLRGRVETEEGIDVKLASRYYSRWALTYDLLPLLRSTKNMGEPVRVMTVLGAGLGPDIDLEDLGLKKTYTGMKAMSQSIAYNDLMMQEFAEREPGIAFIHVYPGNVETGIIVFKNPIAKLLIWLLTPVTWLITVSKEVCAEYMLNVLLSASEGLVRTNGQGDDIGMKRFPKTVGAAKVLWEHTVEAVNVDESRIDVAKGDIIAH